MTPDERERMKMLCERIAKEQEQNAFMKLVQQLNELPDGNGNGSTIIPMPIRGGPLTEMGSKGGCFEI